MGRCHGQDDTQVGPPGRTGHLGDEKAQAVLEESHLLEIESGRRRPTFVPRRGRRFQLRESYL